MTRAVALGVQDVLLLLLAAFLVLLNGFFVASEFAIVKMRGTQVDALEAAGDRRARVARHIQDHLDGYLSAMQLGITAASLGLGWVGEPAIARLLEAPLAAAGVTSEAALHTISFLIGFGIITFAHVVVGELMPKSVAIRHPVATTRRLGRSMLVFYYVSWPFMWALNSMSLAMLKLFGIEAAGPTEMAHTEEEIESIISSVGEEQVTSSVTREVLANVFLLPRLAVRQVMTHRTQVVWLDVDDPLPETLAKARSSGFARFPVVRGGIDEVLGVAHLKDIAFLDDQADPDVLREILRPPLIVPETASLDDALASLLSAKAKMAIVADEHGGTEGIVTVEDILEELVGEIEDAFDEDEPVIVELPDGRLRVKGDAPLHELIERTGLEPGEPEVTTVGGYVVQALGRLPARGESVEVGGWRFTAIHVTKRRIIEVVMERHPTAPRSG